MRIGERLQRAVRDAAIFNAEVQVAPACILWPDKERQWEAVIPDLQREMPELLALGRYEAGASRGPAIWLRCAIAGKAASHQRKDDVPAVLYLPGVSRQDLRAVEECPNHLKPLAELQYRGVIWSQVNAKDWTVLAFLKSDQGGLGLDVALDDGTKSALQLAARRLLEQEIDHLTGKHLDSTYFNELITGGDGPRDLLQWLDQGETFRASRGADEWQAFVQVCKSQFALDPEKDGPLTAAERLAGRQGPWRAAWDRFCEAPKRYPGIPDRIRQTRLPADMFADRGGWPQWNDELEASLRRDLEALSQLPPHAAREQIARLEQRHKGRRELPWAELGHSDLVKALEHLAVMASATNSTLAAGSAQDLAGGYLGGGWQADDSMLRALASVQRSEDLDPLTTAIRAIYLPWAEEAARHLQNVVETSGYPGGDYTTRSVQPHDKGDCVLFVDGLRSDLGKRLAALLADAGCQVQEQPRWVALPTVTATGKAAVAPVTAVLEGKDADSDFEPTLQETGQRLSGGSTLEKLLAEAGWQTLEDNDVGEGKGLAWSEYRAIDKEGHERGSGVAKQIDEKLWALRERALRLFDAGWAKLHVVTDHGWLLLPGGLPKVELPSVVVENKWGRCAALKPGAIANERVFPWYWNPARQFALADGIAVYRGGREYSHGGLSLQESLVLDLVVQPGKARSRGARISGCVWKGLRCAIAVEGDAAGMLADIRTQPGNPSSSVLASTKAVAEDGKVSVVVENDELEGEEAAIVLLDPSGQLLAQYPTVIGGGKA